MTISTVHRFMDAAVRLSSIVHKFMDAMMRLSTDSGQDRQIRGYPHHGWHKDWPHDDVIKWKHFPRYWPFVRGINRPPVNSPHKGHWRGALMFSFICVWINGWVNNHETGDLRRYRTHYDVTVRRCLQLVNFIPKWRHICIWRHRSCSSWVQVMVCLLTAPSHDPNQFCHYSIVHTVQFHQIWLFIQVVRVSVFIMFNQISQLTTIS